MSSTPTRSMSDDIHKAVGSVLDGLITEKAPHARVAAAFNYVTDALNVFRVPNENLGGLFDVLEDPMAAYAWNVLCELGWAKQVYSMHDRYSLQYRLTDLGRNQIVFIKL